MHDSMLLAVVLTFLSSRKDKTLAMLLSLKIRWEDFLNLWSWKVICNEKSIIEWYKNEQLNQLSLITVVVILQRTLYSHVLIPEVRDWPACSQRAPPAGPWECIHPVCPEKGHEPQWVGQTDYKGKGGEKRGGERIRATKGSQLIPQSTTNIHNKFDWYDFSAFSQLIVLKKSIIIVHSESYLIGL